MAGLLNVPIVSILALSIALQVLGDNPVLLQKFLIEIAEFQGSV